MSLTSDRSSVLPDVSVVLDALAGANEVQSNCMFQLALMLARVAIEPCSESYKEETAQALLGLLRSKPKSNVVRLFGAGSARLRHTASEASTIASR